MPTPVPPPPPTVPPTPTDTPNATATTAAKTATAAATQTAAARQTAAAETATAARKTAIAKTATAARKTAIVKTATAAKKTAIVKTATAAKKTAVAKTATAAATQTAAAKTATAIAGIPTATPTPTPAPADPSGWIEASPKEIVVGQTTTITAGWSGLAQDPVIEASSTSLARSCGATGKSIIGPQQTQVWTGCSGGTIAVTLRKASDSSILDSVTVKVYPKPLITGDNREGYRYFKIGWLADSDFTTVNIEWRNHVEPPAAPERWRRLKTDAKSGARAVISGSGASIRGISYKADTDIELRLVAETDSNLEGISPVYKVERGEKPDASGNLIDHTLKYDLSPLPTTGVNLDLANWIRNVFSGYATAWTRSVSNEVTLYACDGEPCRTNGDGLALPVKLGNRCSAKFGCVENNPGDVDTRIRADHNRAMYFPPVPTHGLFTYTWTDDKSKDGAFYRNRTGNPNRTYRYVWINSTVAHELGHAFGLSDRQGRTDYSGLMDADDILFKGDDQIKQDDKDALIAIYETHTRNVGY